MSNIKEKTSKLKYLFIVIFFITSTLLYSFINKMEKRNIKESLDKNTLIYTKAYNTIYTQYKELSEVMFSGLTNLGNIDEKLLTVKDATPQEKDKIRKEIYSKLVKRFNALKSKKLKNINIILHDDTVFLKMMKPKSFGHKVTYRRETILHATKTKTATHSYEIGAYGAGFRFVYPYVKDGKVLGSMAITFGAEAITSSIMKQYSVLSNFFIKTSKFKDEFLKKKQKKVKPSHHEGYLFDLAVLKELKKVTNKEFKNIKPTKKALNAVYKNANSKEPKSIYSKEMNAIVTTIPIMHTLTNEQHAFLTIRSKEDNLKVLNKNFLINLVLGVFLIAAILLVLYQQFLKKILEEKEKVENLKRDKQLLEQAKMAQMGEMIGNIAHQWRQPLSTITTAASGVKVNYEYDILKYEEIPDFMETIIKNADFLSQTIDNFRDFIKEEHNLKEIVIQEKIEKTLSIISATLSSNYINVINTIHYEEPIKMKLVQGVLSQAMMNILNNAKDAMVEKNIEDRWIKLELENYDDKVIVTIEDSAGGIPDDVMPKIFDPYFTTKHQSIGTGLGLYMSKEIVRKHLKGEITVKNTQNGAKFFITVPKIDYKENNE